MDEISIASSIANESIDFSLFSLFLRADFIVKSVIIVLILSSVYSWNIIIAKIVRIKRLKKLKIFRSLNQLLSNADIVSVSVHLNDQTKLMCNDSFFKKMKKNSIFINTSRGEIVKESSLIKALKSKRTKFAAVDVIQNEQKIDLSKNKLIQYSKENNNLIITPHMAGLTYESENLAATITFQNLNKFFKK